VEEPPNEPVSDEESFAASLYELLYRAARLRVRGCVGDPVQQDAIVDRVKDRWWHRCVDGNPPEDSDAWLGVCLYRAIASALTETARRTVHVDDLANLASARDRVETVEERAQREQALARRWAQADARLAWLRENLKRLLEQLPPRQAESLAAWLRSGSYHAAARELGLPRSNVRRAVAGALERLPKIAKKLRIGDPPPSNG